MINTCVDNLYVWCTPDNLPIAATDAQRKCLIVIDLFRNHKSDAHVSVYQSNAFMRSEEAKLTDSIIDSSWVL